MLFISTFYLSVLKTVLYLQPLTKQGRLAQLVQSTWFTPKGSGVRIPQRPHQIEKSMSKDVDFLHLQST